MKLYNINDVFTENPNCNEFRVVVERMPGGVNKLYIHPMNMDGESFDFYEKDGDLSPVKAIDALQQRIKNQIKEVKKTRFTIEDLKIGRCAVVNDGTLDELRSVLKAAFPDSGISCNGDSSYYYRFRYNSDIYSGSDESCLPIQSVKDFLIQEDEK